MWLPEYTDLPEYWYIATLLDIVPARWLRAYQKCEAVLKNLQGFEKWFYTQLLRENVTNIYNLKLTL